MSNESDLLEVAFENEEGHRTKSIEKILGKMKGPTKTHCDECGYEIPKARVEACVKAGMKVTHCVDCLNLLETKGRMYAR